MSLPHEFPRDPLSRLLLAALPPRDPREEIEGDLAEELALFRHPRTWLWAQLLRSAPRLVLFQVTRDTGARRRWHAAATSLFGGSLLLAFARIDRFGAPALTLALAGMLILAAGQLVTRSALTASSQLLGSLALAATMLTAARAGSALGIDDQTATLVLVAVWFLPVMAPEPRKSRRGCGSSTPRRA